MMKKSVKLLMALMALVLCQVGLAENKSIEDGVFTQAQVDAGEPIFDGACSICHDMRFYRDILKAYNNQSVLWLWDSIVGTMPAGNPGSLMLEEYTNVLAYIFSANGFPTGDIELDPDNGMESILIVSP
jgi:mono/diheme cytochrome c family protein